jgi:hypothetical protein
VNGKLFDSAERDASGVTVFSLVRISGWAGGSPFFSSLLLSPFAMTLGSQRRR